MQWGLIFPRPTWEPDKVRIWRIYPRQEEATLTDRKETSCDLQRWQKIRRWTPPSSVTTTSLTRTSCKWQNVPKLILFPTDGLLYIYRYSPDRLSWYRIRHVCVFASIDIDLYWRQAICATRLFQFSFKGIGGKTRILSVFSFTTTLKFPECRFTGDHNVLLGCSARFQKIKKPSLLHKWPGPVIL